MNLREILSESEFLEATRKSDALAWSLIAFDWSVIIGIFIVVANYPNPITLLLAIILLGGRQLGLGVVVHETGHRTLFRTPFLNDFCGKWLAGYWVFSDKDAYMRGHLKHHQDAGTEEDPDLANYVDYPVSRDRLRRKITRDLTGQIGWRRMKSIGRSIVRITTLKPHLRQMVLRALALNIFMLALLVLFAQAWLYLLWVVAFMTSHMLVTRIRQIAEHGAVPDHFSNDARLNTRTLYISPLERLLIAPHQVNFHLEHHLMASVPIYRLRRLHDLLKSKGYYEDVEFTTGYINLLRQVTYPVSQGS